MSNQPYDEAVDVEGSEVETPRNNNMGTTNKNQYVPTFARSEDLDLDLSDNTSNKDYGEQAENDMLKESIGAEDSQLGDSQNSRMMGGGELDESDDDDDDDDDDEGVNISGQYDASLFHNLPVTTEIKDLFQFIGAYRAQTVELETTLKPFVLDFIPAVGDIDAFIKIPRPDEVEDNLGLVILDEPCAQQSDSTVLNLHLRALTKEEGASKETVAKELNRADKNPKEIEQWIANISELHKAKPATSVHYSRPMPDIDTLMQEWPPAVEDGLKTLELPSGAEMGMKLEEYVDVVCTLLDIPVHGNRVHALHLLFTLYSEFKNSEHFKALADDNKIDNDENPFGNTDRLEL